MIEHHSLVAAVFVRDLAHRHASTVRSLLLAGVDRVVVGSPDITNSADLLFDDRVEVVPATHVAAFVNEVSDRFGCTVVACDVPVVVPEQAFSPALGLIAGDPRVATVNVWLLVEQSVRRWWRDVLGAPEAVTAEDMPQGGYTETASLFHVDLDETAARIDAEVNALSPSSTTACTGF